METTTVSPVTDELESHEPEQLTTVKEQCARDWKQVKNLQSQLQSLEPLVLDETRPSQQILQEQEKRCKAELQYLKENSLKTLPEDPAIQRLLLQQSQETRHEQLSETLVFLRAKREEVLAGIKAEEEANELLLGLNKSLKEKVATCGGSVSDDNSALEMAVNRLKVDLDKVNELDKFFRRELKQLLTHHFPLPSETDSAKNLEDTRDFDRESALPLTAILKSLIEQTLNSPAQPYIEMDDRFWSRHIELLLRCQIVLKDPNNPNRIKLVPFHL
ncbi:centromere protein K [Aplysia californica]|uniref:Centromere protein K n=1 Tax=Aplysia californica TaxID=6500 RepID=A0ABM0JLU2_APLCA|nr:centromere protein K [Aplysia californica]